MFFLERMALVRAWYPDEAEEKQWERCQKLLATSTAKHIVRVSGMRDAVTELTATGAEDFSELKKHLDEQETEALIHARFSAGKAAPEHWTPEALKTLRPSGDGVILSWQVSRQCFAGYYPRVPTGTDVEKAEREKKKLKKHHSTSRTYGGKWTKSEALTLVVRFLWRKHKKQGHDCSMQPDDDAIAEALSMALKDLPDEDEDEPPKVRKRTRGKQAPRESVAKKPRHSPSVSSAEAPDSDAEMKDFLSSEGGSVSSDSEKKKSKKPEKKAKSKPKPATKTKGKKEAAKTSADKPTAEAPPTDKSSAAEPSTDKPAASAKGAAAAGKMLGASAAAASRIREITSQIDYDEIKRRQEKQDRLLPGWGMSSSSRAPPTPASTCPLSMSQ